MSQRNSSALLRRQKDLKRGIRFTMMVCGSSGTGKTSFVNSILDQNILPHRFQYDKLQSENTVPKTITFANLSGAVTDAADYEKYFDAELSSREPGIAVTETSVEILDEDDSKLLLTIIDTPGFGDNINNEICTSEIIHFLEQQFDLVLGEETRVRRNPRFEDTRVHVCLYFITPTGHGLRELDVETMKSLSKYVNIIPVIGRADSFTKVELINFKRNIMEDIERFDIPIFQFSIDEDDDDDELIEENRYLSQLQPFAIITSDEEAEINGKKTRVRRYPWGTIDITDTSYSDFAILKSVLLGSHLQDLKDITHDFLYETYRTEKLMSVSELDEFNEEGGEGYSSRSEPPSMSNLADIANSKSMARFDVYPSNGASARKFSTDSTASTRINKDTDSLTSKLNGVNINENGNGHATDKIPVKKSSMLIDDNETIASSATKQNGSNEEPDMLPSKDDNYLFQNDDELTSMTDEKDLPPPPTTRGTDSSTPITSPRIQHSPSLSSQYSGSPSVTTKQLRKISETIPYLLKHDSLISKQQKLEELEKKSAIELSKRAADLEKKALELKLREKNLIGASGTGDGDIAASNGESNGHDQTDVTESTANDAASYEEGDDEYVDSVQT
ncbi:hypothetical protein CANARDRAFT_169116 [[Candida] arabinofermentans NRRL YB-2248]|uniref:Septin-type G domain-containing protein n=1 Tax=[Candida] arabinofermentans NRRL YB-2248 TaxID=983967 RepID=A0A1E4SZQ1_9ASCO|nr:hypothetical protein CANARDRAFT_169116 [[Candida] arabinofermentans NRRL YB-2248]